MTRTIIFGDVHGCIEEWRALMKKLKVTDADRLISVGDLVCKGPSTKEVLDLAMKTPNLQCVKGNHEYELLEYWKENALDSLPKEYQHRAIRELGREVDRYMKYLDSWPFYLDFPDLLVVHAGIRSGISLPKQDPGEMTNVRLIGGKPWYENYRESKLIVHGHWAGQGLVVRENVIGLDSGCVYGRELSAVILPERKIVSVPAKKAYVPV